MCNSCLLIEHESGVNLDIRKNIKRHSTRVSDFLEDFTYIRLVSKNKNKNTYFAQTKHI